jgi:hypothetical protein
MPVRINYKPKSESKIVTVKDSTTGKTTKLTKKNGTYTRGGNVVTLTKSQKEVPNKMKHGGPYNAHHPMKMKHSAYDMKDSAYNMKSPYNMKPQILKHMSGK